MNPRMGRWAVLASLAVTLGCGGDGDGGNGPGPHGLVGTWEATKVELVNAANPAQKVDLVAMGGTLTVELNTNQTCRLVTTFPGEPTETITGTWSGSSDVITIHYTGPGYSVTWQFDWSLAGNVLAMNGAHGDFDFDGDDVDEAAIINLVLVRQ